MKVDFVFVYYKATTTLNNSNVNSNRNINDEDGGDNNDGNDFFLFAIRVTANGTLLE